MSRNQDRGIWSSVIIVMAMSSWCPESLERKIDVQKKRFRMTQLNHMRAEKIYVQKLLSGQSLDHMSVTIQNPNRGQRKWWQSDSIESDVTTCMMWHRCDDNDDELRKIQSRILIRAERFKYMTSHVIQKSGQRHISYVQKSGQRVMLSFFSLPCFLGNECPWYLCPDFWMSWWCNDRDIIWIICQSCDYDISLTW